ncbi:hypothetical protein LTR56_020539 [Elasticomyces elasticus]|nr:hypothetical protein LTR56_020539 [Elasticomyces elasticus]KAK3655854.1 hypothetical protein LTR22_010149 [Elasticomyces elasticus]KAK4925808.1 hypothetical protein LTR49_007184 [Elasticomyces elasticus]KAK5764761.1 hypothetical protein LTS12_005030 [Elasticomyces elasticus]
MAPATAPTLAAGGTKRSFSGTPLIGNNRMSALYQPTLVSVHLGSKDKQGYQVPRGLICGMSDYFEKAFDPRFVEGQTGKIVLDDVKPWVFECFIGWLYTQKVFWDASATSSDGLPRLGPTIDRRPMEEGSAEHLTDVNLLDPIHWRWDQLIQIYVFADKYYTR